MLAPPPDLSGGSLAISRLGLEPTPSGVIPEARAFRLLGNQSPPGESGAGAI